MYSDNTHCRRRITVQLVSSLIRLNLTYEENALIFVCGGVAAVESELVKLETSGIVILPTTVSGCVS